MHHVPGEIRRWRKAVLLVPLFLMVQTSCALWSTKKGDEVQGLSEARLLRESGRPDQALLALARLDDGLGPRSKRATYRFEIGLCHVELGNESAAQDAFRTAHAWAGNPQQRNAAGIELAWSYLRAGSFTLAAHYFDRVLASGVPENYSEGHVRYHLAVCYQRLGRPAEAKAQYDQANGYRPEPGSRFVYESPPAPKDSSLTESIIKEDGLAMIPRQRWGASPPGDNHDPMGRIRRVTVHHTATPDPGKVLKKNLVAVKKIQRYHQMPPADGGQGWADIGYHYLIDSGGRVYEGRSLALQGAHAGGEANEGNIGVALIGDFGRRPPSAEQARALRSLLGELSRRYKIAVGSIYTHRELREAQLGGGTMCPGPHVERIVVQLRKDLTMPSAERRRRTPQEGVRHVVRKGENLWKIARTYGTTVARLVESNRVRDADRIKVGEILRIPVQAP